jgi:hypothetical protein
MKERENCKYCGSDNTSTSQKVFENGSLHTALGCNDCNRHIKYVKKNAKKKQKQKHNYNKKCNAMAKTIGFKTFYEYQNSGMWETLVEMVLSNKQWCVFCNKKGHAIAHSDYSVDILLGKRLSVIHTVCKKCDYKINHTKTDKKRNLSEKLRFVRECLQLGRMAA